MIGLLLAQTDQAQLRLMPTAFGRPARLAWAWALGWLACLALATEAPDGRLFELKWSVHPDHFQASFFDRRCRRPSIAPLGRLQKLSGSVMRIMTPRAASPLDLFRIGSTEGEPTVILLPSYQGNDPGCRLRAPGDGSHVTVPPHTISVCASPLASQLFSSIGVLQIGFQRPRQDDGRSCRRRHRLRHAGRCRRQLQPDRPGVEPDVDVARSCGLGPPAVGAVSRSPASDSAAAMSLRGPPPLVPQRCLCAARSTDSCSAQHRVQRRERQLQRFRGHAELCRSGA